MHGDLGTQEDVYDNLKNYYDHYCFEKTASVHVYNTWSILNFFANVGNGNACYEVTFVNYYFY